MNAKQRITQLEKRKAASGDTSIQVFILNEDGGALTSDAAGNTKEYTAAEYAEHLKQCAARGEEIIHVTPEEKGGNE